MPDIEIVLVGPMYEGNVGFAARAMKNFGFGRLILISPCPIGEEAKARAAHAQDILYGAEYTGLDEVIDRSDLVVATTGAVSQSVCRPMRMPYFSPRELRARIMDLEGRVAVLFGRENWGLNNEEVARADMVCTIPASPGYPILNLSHAVAVVCYELAGLPGGEYQLASRFEMDHLYDHISRFLDEIGHPAHKRERTMLLLRRVLGRSRLTAREASTIHGLLRRAERQIRLKG
jgi:tRNA/rRNA methyltransferase